MAVELDPWEDVDFVVDRRCMEARVGDEIAYVPKAKINEHLSQISIHPGSLSYGTIKRIESKGFAFADSGAPMRITLVNGDVLDGNTEWGADLLVLPPKSKR